MVAALVAAALRNLEAFDWLDAGTLVLADHARTASASGAVNSFAFVTVCQRGTPAPPNPSPAAVFVGKDGVGRCFFGWRLARGGWRRGSFSPSGASGVQATPSRAE
jgi:hypothetical protein